VHSSLLRSANIATRAPLERNPLRRARYAFELGPASSTGVELASYTSNSTNEVLVRRPNKGNVNFHRKQRRLSVIGQAVRMSQLSSMEGGNLNRVSGSSIISKKAAGTSLRDVRRPNDGSSEECLAINAENACSPDALNSSSLTTAETQLVYLSRHVNTTTTSNTPNPPKAATTKSSNSTKPLNQASKPPCSFLNFSHLQSAPGPSPHEVRANKRPGIQAHCSSSHA
jgi:hypothetical protein